MWWLELEIKSAFHTISWLHGVRLNAVWCANLLLIREQCLDSLTVLNHDLTVCRNPLGFLLVFLQDMVLTMQEHMLLFQVLISALLLFRWYMSRKRYLFILNIITGHLDTSKKASAALLSYSFIIYEGMAEVLGTIYLMVWHWHSEALNLQFSLLNFFQCLDNSTPLNTFIILTIIIKEWHWAWE